MERVGHGFAQTTESDQIALRFRAVFRRRKLLILACMVVGTGPVVYYNETCPRTYESSVTMIMDEFVGPTASFSADQSTDTRMSNRLQELSSFAFASEVAKALAPESQGRFTLPDPAPPDFSEVEFFATQVHRSVTAYAVRGSNLLKVAAHTHDPMLSHDIASTAVRVFEERNARIEREGVTGIRRFVEDQLARFEVQLTESEEALRRYQEEHDIASFTTQSNEVLRRMTDAEVAYNSAKANRQSLEQKLAFIEESLVLQRRDLVPSVIEVGNPWVQRLKARLVELQLQYTELRVQNYAVDHPKLVQLEDEIVRTKNQLSEEAAKIAGGDNVVDPIVQIEKYTTDASMLRIEIETLKAQERALGSVIAEYEKRLQSLPEKELNLARLTRERDVNQKIYNSLLEKLEESKMSQAEQIPTVRIIDTAYVNEVPIKPKKRLNLAVGLLFGFLAGTSIGFLRERASSSIESARELEKLTGWRVVGTLPRILKLPSERLKLERPMGAKEVRQVKRSLISVLEPHGGPAEAFRILRTNLQARGLGSERRSLLITSVAPNEGKSTIVTNLATSLAGIGEKVLLVDAELRRPGMHRVFGVEEHPGLRDLLVTKMEAWEGGRAPAPREPVKPKHRGQNGGGTATETITETTTRPSVYSSAFESAFQATRIEKLRVLATGSETGNANDLISTYADRMTALLQDLKKEFKFIVIDCPPISLVHDAALLARLADCVLFVVNSTRVDREQLLICRDLLESSGAHVIGAVLNHVEPVGIYRTNKYYHSK
ncbi:MAG: polysaccharide biosynthesis tyrosine autokinase [bacterium]